jgi:hypothetical protein
MARVRREKFRAYGMRTGTELILMLRFYALVLGLIFAGMVFTLVAFMLNK